MAGNLTEVLEKHTEHLARQWADSLHSEALSSYADRSLDELIGTTAHAAQMNFAALVHGDFSKVDVFIDEICRMRLEAGFSLSEIQWAFELYRTLLTPILVEELEGEALLKALKSLNTCLSRTIFAFSDYFLKMANARLTEKQRKLDEDLQAAAGIQQALLPGRQAKRPRRLLKDGVSASEGDGRTTEDPTSRHSAQRASGSDDRGLSAQQPDKAEVVEIDWKFMPSEKIGGDIFNMIRLDEDHLGFYMVDVSGHGVPPALVTFSIAQTLQPHMGYTIRHRPGYSPDYEIVPPGEVLKALDAEFPWERFEKFLTTIYLIIDIRNGSLVYSNAAHPPPILLHADGSFELLEKGGTIIGLDGILPFEEEEKQLVPGDKIVLYTDGVFEFRDLSGEIFGEERFHDLVRDLRHLPIGMMLDEIIRTVEVLVRGVKLEDDVSLLGIEFKGRSIGT